MRKDYFLIFKEAINNLAKYSDCNNATISIQKIHQTIVTKIKDDGKGFNPELINSGNGVKNMRYRAKSLKGKFQIETQPGKGTEVTLTIPVT